MAVPRNLGCKFLVGFIFQDGTCLKTIGIKEFSGCESLQVSLASKS